MSWGYISGYVSYGVCVQGVSVQGVSVQGGKCLGESVRGYMSGGVLSCLNPSLSIHFEFSISNDEADLSGTVGREHF